MKLSYDEIRRIHREEKNSSRLVEVESGFYNELNDFIKEEKKEYLDSLKDFSMGKARGFTNMKKMVEEIFMMREKKILSRALIASRTEEVTKRNMASQEEALFESVMCSLEKHNSLLEELFSAAEKKDSSRKGLNTLPVRILSDIPAFVGADMKEYGPYKKGDAAELPYKVGKLLLSRKLAEADE